MCTRTSMSSHEVAISKVSLGGGGGGFVLMLLGVVFHSCGQMFNIWFMKTLLPMLVSFPCQSHSHVSPIPMSAPFPFSLIPMSVPSPCQSHSHVSLIPMSVSSHVSLVPMPVSFPCQFHSHVSLIPMLQPVYTL